MSIYSFNESGTRMFRSRLNIGYRKLFDMDFARLVPFCCKFILPGDVGKIGAECFIRYQPTLAPPLTRSWARLRWFFVPLRLVEPNAEKIITGSENGRLITTELPQFANLLQNSFLSSSKQVVKWSFCDYFGMPIGDYSAILASGNVKCIPAAYWYKAYLRIAFDYYEDENFRSQDNFDDYWLAHAGLPALSQDRSLISPCLHKDYFTSSLPWQLKGTAPTFTIDPSLDFSDVVNKFGTTENAYDVKLGIVKNGTTITSPGLEASYTPEGESIEIYNDTLAGVLNRAKVSPASFTMDDLRTMAAQTRVFERLARCGSRYTEYLHANFGVAPADGTLQRAQYLGGFSQPIVTTEVVQTGGDSTEVGTLRGHGISSGGNSIGVHKFKEFGILMGLIDVMPELVYTQGINREYTYKSRFDFFNPSFQHLSEQEVRNGELYIDFTNTSEHPHQNDDVFGYQAIYNELRSSQDQVAGDLRDSLAYWQQGITFASRPNLNAAFLKASNYLSDFKRPFQVLDGAMPIICDIGNHLDFWRPMVKYGTPGLVDHL